MNATEVMNRALTFGVELIPDGRLLRLRAPQCPPDNLLADLRAFKDDILALLQPRRYPYTYRTTDGDGGVYLTTTVATSVAFAELQVTYGDRLSWAMRTW